MNRKRVRAFCLTLLFYAIAGPLLGLLVILVIGVAVEAWGPIADRVQALISPVPSPSCGSPYSGHFDPGCFQQVPGPRQFRFAAPDLQRLPLVVFASYGLGLIPALFAGVLICVGRLQSLGFGYAVGIGALVGFLFTGALLPGPGTSILHPEGVIWTFFICFVPTIVCWLVTRRLWREPETADTNSAG